MSFYAALSAATTVEDFICAVADLGNAETGDVSDWDEQEIVDTLHAIIEAARRYQQPMDSSVARMYEALDTAYAGLRDSEKRTSALDAVRKALRR